MPKEIWRPFPFDDLGTFYQVSNLGHCRTTDYHRHPNAIIRGQNKSNYQNRMRKGPKYRIFHIHMPSRNINKYYLAHRCVAAAFIPNPKNKPQVNHKNGIKNDNRKTNLEWCTPLENDRHARQVLKIKVPYFKIGGRHPMAILKAKDVRWMHKHAKVLTQSVMARRFKVSPRCVSRVLTGSGWNHIWKEYHK